MFFWKRLKEEKLLLILLAVAVVLLVLNPGSASHLYSCVDWVTIIILAGLLMISNGIRESNVLDRFSLKIFQHVRTERSLALFLILISSIFSMFLTNDITLFIVVPLTLSLQKFLKNDIKIIVFFEALAVNVGSTLTPIGNPQNLLLWHMWKVSFSTFILKMMPLELSMVTLLLLFATVVFKGKTLSLMARIPMKLDKRLAVLSMTLLALYILLMQIHLARFIVIFIFILYVFLSAKTLKKVDWFLLVVFVFMFIDVHLFSNFSWVVSLVKIANLQNPIHLFLFSVGFSQLASNVPAAIFVSKFSNLYLPILYGVNIGGNGFVIGSLANIIALRMVKGKRIYTSFHRYSFTYFFITLLVGYLLMKILYLQ